MILDRLLDLEKNPVARLYSAQEYDLDGFRRWVQSLDNPGMRLPFVHIAGTKGKGSTAALIESLLRGLGFDTALYSSPHLAHFGERFRFNGVAWTEAELAAAVERLMTRLPAEMRKPIEDPHSFRTVFEVLTLLALFEFEAFQKRLPAGRQLVVIWETGLGGRLDCTNIVDPLVSVITAIGYDHVSILGTTLEQITTEKAGIIKPGRPVVLARQPAEHADAVVPIIRERAGQLQAPLIEAWEYAPVLGGKLQTQGQQVRIRLPNQREELLTLPLLGVHQRHNLEAAVSAGWLVWKALAGEREYGVFTRGVANTYWPGRLELLQHSNGQCLILDGAHCALSAKTLLTALADWQMSGCAVWKPPLRLLWSMQRDKQHEAFLSNLCESAPPGFFAGVETYRLPSPRSADPVELAHLAHRLGLPARAHGSARVALTTALTTSEDILAAGTLYTSAELRDSWMNRVQ